MGRRDNLAGATTGYRHTARTVPVVPTSDDVHQALNAGGVFVARAPNTVSPLGDHIRGDCATARARLGNGSRVRDSLNTLDHVK